jgi:flavin-dependent dehydrogenase
VLLIDRKPVGTGQTSACGTILQVLQRWDATAAVLQTHQKLVSHNAGQATVFPSPYLWCTFDYRQLCETLLERSGSDFLQATVRGYDGDQVHTSRGSVRAHCVVDASGWRAVLASSIVPDYASRSAMSFGIETMTALPDRARVDPSALHFWHDTAVLPHGIGWVFPRGDTASIGLASFRGATRLRHHLEGFAARCGVQPSGVHGTYLPCALRAPTAGRVFVVGDAAGMCIGLSGEGIRPALFFGQICGQIIGRVLKGELTLQGGLDEYSATVAARRPFFRFFSRAQAILSRIPMSWGDRVVLLACRKLARSLLFDQYWRLTREWDRS